MSKVAAKAKLRTVEVEQAQAIPAHAAVFSPSGIAANDSLQEELEARYGAGFAQWVIDGLNRRSKV